MKKNIVTPVVFVLLLFIIFTGMTMVTKASGSETGEENTNSANPPIDADESPALLAPHKPDYLYNGVTTSDTHANPPVQNELQTRFLTIAYNNDKLLYDFSASLRKGGFSSLFGRKNSLTMAENVTKKVDALVEKVAMILDMYPSNLQARIELLPTHSDVQALYRARYKKNTELIAFYSPKEKTIYVSVWDIKTQVLAHELAHAVLDHYFEVDPPVKIHELLAQYVESKL